MTGVNRRHQRKQHSRASADRDTGNKDAPVDASWQINDDSGRRRGERKDKRIATPVGNRDSTRGGDQRQEEAFCEKLFDQTSSSRAERKTHCHFVPAQQRTREQKVADVRARYEQNKKYDRHRDGEGRGHITGLIERCSPQRRERKVAAAIRFRISLLQALRNCMKLGIRLLTSDAGFEKRVAFDPTFTAFF